MDNELSVVNLQQFRKNCLCQFQGGILIAPHKCPVPWCPVDDPMKIARFEIQLKRYQITNAPIFVAPIQLLGQTDRFRKVDSWNEIMLVIYVY